MGHVLGSMLANGDTLAKRERGKKGDFPLRNLELKRMLDR